MSGFALSVKHASYQITNTLDHVDIKLLFVTFRNMANNLSHDYGTKGLGDRMLHVHHVFNWLFLNQ